MWENVTLLYYFSQTQSNLLATDIKWWQVKSSGFVAVFVLLGGLFCSCLVYLFNNLKILRLLKSSFTTKVYLNTLEGEKFSLSEV